DFVTKGGMQVKAGQVFDNGKVVDLEEEYGREGRDQLLSQLLLDPKQMQQIYRDPDMPRRLSREVDAAIERNTNELNAAFTQGEFNEKVKEDAQSGTTEKVGVASSIIGGMAF